MKTFVEQLVAGNVTIDALDDFVDEWHALETGDLTLHTFLGLTWDEYKVVVLQPYALKHVVQARKDGADTVFPEIIDCACGNDHMTVPTDTEYDDETDESFIYELVCRIHKKHEPCRPCLYGTSGVLR